MKKSFNKIISVVLALSIIAVCTVSAFAAEITAQEAESIAVNHAGYKVSEVVFGYTEVDYERGQKIYEVEFFVDHGNGSYTEYDYDVNVADGKIIKFSSEKEFSKLPPVADTNDIGLEKAKENALDAFGLNPADVELVKAFKEYDDGRAVYEIEYRQGYDKEFSCEVDAATGEVYDMDVDVNNTVFDKIELFFEIIEYFFKSLFNK